MKKTLLVFSFLLFISLNLNAQNSWQLVSNVPNNVAINSISVVNQNVIWVACDVGRVYRTIDAGLTWELRSTGIPGSGNNLYGISALDTTNCWVGDGSGRIWRTSNGGNAWVQQLSIPGGFFNGIHMFDLNRGMITGDPTANGQPYQNRTTTDGGNTWILPAGMFTGSNEFGVINAWDWIDSNTVWIGSANILPSPSTAKIYRTTTGYSGTWSFATVTGTGATAGLYYQAIAFTDANNGMSASNNSNIVKTTNGGVTWTAVTNPPGVSVFAAINMYGFKDGSNLIRMSINETTGYRMFRTTNYGTTWIEETLPPQGLANGVQHMRFLNQNLGYGGGGLGTFYVYGPSTSISQNGNEAPESYSLLQNFPNPFNPSTTISFNLPASNFVNLKVYNSLGKEVAVLVSEQLNSGSYNIGFDASALNSGVYFYSLETSDFRDTKKMLLIK